MTPGYRAPRDAALTALLREAWPRRVLAFSFCEGMLVFGGLAFLPVHLHQRFGLPMGRAGAIVMLYGVGGLLYSGLARPLVAALGEVRLACAGGALMALYLGLLAVATSWMWAVPACIAGGFGFYMLHTTLQTHATEMMPSARGSAVTLFSAALFMGQSAGVAAASIVVARASAVPVFAVTAFGIPALAALFAREVRLLRSR